MAINENTGSGLGENQHQHPVTLTRRTSSNLTTVSTPSYVYRRHNQQEIANSPSDFILSGIIIVPPFVIGIASTVKQQHKITTKEPTPFVIRFASV